MKTFIYALIDPRTNRIRYIGRTFKPKLRLWQHIDYAKKGIQRHCCQWIRQLLAVNLSPRMMILEECSTDGAAEEIHHILVARLDGIDLTNHCDGGRGGHPGMKKPPMPAEQRAKLIATKNTPEAKLKVSQRFKGQKLSPEHLEHLRTIRSTPEARRRQSEMSTGRKMSPESRSKLSSSLRNSEARRKATPLHREKVKVLKGERAAEAVRLYLSPLAKNKVAKRMGCSQGAVDTAIADACGIDLRIAMAVSDRKRLTHELRNSALRGQKRTREQIERHAASIRGRLVSDDERKRVSQGLRNRTPEQLDRWRENLRETRRRKKLTQSAPVN